MNSKSLLKSSRASWRLNIEDTNLFCIHGKFIFNTFHVCSKGLCVLRSRIWWGVFKLRDVDDGNGIIVFIFVHFLLPSVSNMWYHEKLSWHIFTGRIEGKKDTSRIRTTTYKSWEEQKGEKTIARSGNRRSNRSRSQSHVEYDLTNERYDDAIQAHLENGQKIKILRQKQIIFMLRPL